MAWLRGAELPKLVKIEELLGGGGPSERRRDQEKAAAPPEPDPPKSAGPPPEPKEAPSAGPTTGGLETPDTPSPEPEPPAGHDGPRTAARATAPEPPETVDERAGATEPEAPRDLEGQDPHEAFLELVSRRKQSLAAHLSEAQGLELEDGVLTIYAPPGDTWLETTLQRASNAAILEDAIRAVWGPGLSWRLAPGSGKPAVEKLVDKPVEDPRVEAALEDPRVQTVLDIFGGSVESVEERGMSE